MAPVGIQIGDNYDQQLLGRVIAVRSTLGAIVAPLGCILSNGIDCVRHAIQSDRLPQPTYATI